MVDNLEYNSTREKLIIPEYGRNVQKMVEQCCKISDREERNKSARSIISAMAQIQGFKTDPTDEQLHKLWDHLIIISRFRLNIDAPYERPEDIQETFHPEKPTYNTAITNSYRSYGRNMKGLADTIALVEDLEERQKLTLLLANHMKKCYLQWNRDSVTDDVIISQLRILSGGKLSVPDDTLLMPSNVIMELYHNDAAVPTKMPKKNIEDKTKKNNGKKKSKKFKV